MSPAGPPSLTELVSAARDGDERAWAQLVDRVKNVIWKNALGFNLSRADTEDAYSSTLFRLAEHLDSIRDPEYLPGWLATTTRNECRVLLRRQRRISNPYPDPTSLVTAADHDAALLDSELKRSVREAFEALGERCRDLLRMLTCDPPLSYSEVSVALGMPVGSIGPTRERCLEEIRSKRPLRAFVDGRVRKAR